MEETRAGLSVSELLLLLKKAVLFNFSQERRKYYLLEFRTLMEILQRI